MASEKRRDDGAVGTGRQALSVMVWQLLTTTCWRHAISVDAWQCNYENYAPVSCVTFSHDLPVLFCLCKSVRRTDNVRRRGLAHTQKNA